MKLGIYIVKVSIYEFSSYTYFCILDIYYSWLCNNIFGLYLLFNKKEIILAKEYMSILYKKSIFAIEKLVFVTKVAIFFI